MVRRYAAGTAAGAALIVSLTGCQGDGGSAKENGVKVSAAQAISLTSQQTSTVNAYKVDVTAAGSGSAAPKMHGVIQVRLRPDVAATGTLDRASYKGQTVPGGERAILLGDNFYAKVPQQLSQFTGGKPWVRFSVSEAERQAGVNVDGLIKQANPADQTKIFTGSKDVQRVGSESVDGVKTTHYHGTLTPEQAATALDAKTQKSFQQFYQRPGARNVAFDLWVGRDNLPRKLVTKVPAKQGTGSVTMVFSNYNKSFKVSAPPANEVADGNQLKNSVAGKRTPGTPG
jgi:hypothetical protein